MDKQFILGTRKIDLQPGARIVRREELNVLYDADEIISKAAQAAERIEQKAQEDYQRRYEEGFAQGQEEGKSEYAMKIMEMVMTQLDSLEGLERQLTEVVISSVEKLIGTFDKQELAVRIVRKSLAAVRGEKRVLVRVSLQDEPAVRADLQPFLFPEYLPHPNTWGIRMNFAPKLFRTTNQHYRTEHTTRLNLYFTDHVTDTFG